VTDGDSPGVAVVLSFDFDAESLWMAWGARGAKALSRGEFAARVGVPRILDLLRDRGIRSSWFIPGHDADMHPELVARIATEGHEIGNHGYLHENLSNRGDDEVRDILRRGNRAIERITGVRPVGFRAPDGDFDRHLLELLVEEGFRYDSSMKDGESEVYWARGPDVLHDDAANVLGPSLDLIEVPQSWLMQDFIFLERNYRDPTLIGGYTPSQLEEMWFGQLDYVCDRIGTGVITLTTHPQCIGWGSRITLLERFIDRVHSHSGTRFATCTDIADEFRERSR
jgi:peptidoglycan/xylan/chitin deacetylase (PgdA/CDA1 family)